MLTILFGRAGTGKSERLLQRMKEEGRRGAQILLVPEHASHQAEVDLCRICGPTSSRYAEVLSFRRLCDRVLSVSGGGARVTLDGGGKLLNLQKALLETAPVLTVYRRPSRKTAFLRQLLDLFEELRCYEVEPRDLYDQAQALSGAMKDKLSDLSLLYGAYEARLLRPGFDARDRMTKLCDGLEDSGYVRGKDIYIDGFTYFTAQERRVLSVMLRQARSVTVTLLGEPESREELFEPSLKTAERLRLLAEAERCPVEVETLVRRPGTALEHLERYFFGGTVPYDGEAGEAVRLREAGGSYDEVEQTAADIRRLAAAGKCRYRDIAVAARNMEEYEGIIEAVFERWEIPIYLSRRSDILEKPALSLLTGVLSAIENGYEYDDMFRWLKTGLSGLTAEECDLLENYVLKWEIHGQMWLRDVDWTENPDGYGAPWTEGREALLNRVNIIRRRIREPLAGLAQGLKAGETAGEKIDALYTFLESLGLQGALERQMAAQAEAGRLQEAEETAQLWEILCGVLDQFMETLGEERMELDEFSRLLRQVLAEYSVGTIPVSLDQVSVSGINRNDRHNSKYLFLLGANDNVLPSPGKRGGILTEEDREALFQRGIHLAPFGVEQMDIELQNLYAALARPTEGLTVSYPAADAAGTALRPAFVVGRLQELFPGLSIRREDRSCRLTAPLPALETAVPGDALWRYFQRSPANHGRLEAMERAAALKRGSLSPRAARVLYGERISMSASRAERMRSCHFSFFMEYGLQARPRTAAAFDAPQIGTFLHFLLEHVTREVLELGGFARVEEKTLHALVRKYIQEYVERELRNFRGRDSRFRYLFGRLRQLAYAVVDQAAEELRHSDFVPLEFEFSFGDGGKLPAVRISEPDAELRIGGKVDRVDGWTKDGKLYLRVVDYKSGRKSFDLSSVRMGLDIQMLLYLFTLQKEGKGYFGQDIEPAGVLYLPARDEILSMERNVTPEALQKEREKHLRRSGLLLSEPDVLRAMEHEALTEPHYLPVRVDKKGGISGSIASAARLGKLGAYVDRQMRAIAGEIRNIDADPCCHSEQDSPCRFCSWAGACHFQEGRGGDRTRTIPSMSMEEFWERLEREGEEA